MLRLIFPHPADDLRVLLLLPPIPSDCSLFRRNTISRHFRILSDNTGLLKNDGRWFDSVGELGTSMGRLVFCFSFAAPGNPNTFSAGVWSLRIGSVWAWQDRFAPIRNMTIVESTASFLLGVKVLPAQRNGQETPRNCPTPPASPCIPSAGGLVP